MMKLPWYALFAYIGATMVAAVAGMVSGWVPRRELSGVVMPLYFGTFLAMMALAYCLSGNTVLHHHRTGTIQRANNPTTFRVVVFVHVGLSFILIAMGVVRWMGSRG
jgi:hypothetical protein